MSVFTVDTEAVQAANSAARAMTATPHAASARKGSGRKGIVLWASADRARMATARVENRSATTGRSPLKPARRALTSPSIPTIPLRP